jgi:hypothetical protein
MHLPRQLLQQQALVLRRHVPLVSVTCWAATAAGNGSGIAAATGSSSSRATAVSGNVMHLHGCKAGAVQVPLGATGSPAAAAADVTLLLPASAICQSQQQQQQQQQQAMLIKQCLLFQAWAYK